MCYLQTFSPILWVAVLLFWCAKFLNFLNSNLSIVLFPIMCYLRNYCQVLCESFALCFLASIFCLTLRTRCFCFRLVFSDYFCKWQNLTLCALWLQRSASACPRAVFLKINLCVYGGHLVLPIAITRKNLRFFWQ